MLGRIGKQFGKSMEYVLKKKRKVSCEGFAAKKSLVLSLE